MAEVQSKASEQKIRMVADQSGLYVPGVSTWGSAFPGYLGSCGSFQ